MCISGRVSLLILVGVHSSLEILVIAAGDTVLVSPAHAP